MTIQFGYGFQLDDDLVNPSKFLDFLKGYPEDYEVYQKYLKGINEKESGETALEWITNYFNERFCGYGLPVFFCQKMNEEEGIDFYCDGYSIIFPENLPWNYNEKERTLCRKDVDAVFDKWVAKISDELLIYDELAIDD